MPFTFTSPTTFTSLRAPLIRLAHLSTTFPIEFIVTVFVGVTLVYFQLLKVVRTSDFLLLPEDVDVGSSNFNMRSIVYDSLSRNWTTRAAVEVAPIGQDKELWLNQFSIKHSDIDSARVNELEYAIADIITKSNCYRLSPTACLQHHSTLDANINLRSLFFDSLNASEHFIYTDLDSLGLHSRSESTDNGLFLQRNTRRQGGATKYMSFFRKGRYLESDGSDVDVAGNEKVTREEMKSITWMLFAIRAFVMRFYYLAKVSLCIRIASSTLTDTNRRNP